jgi:NAD(P)-dependent dehydrogenase (short-subunit alcohol dehydrogenase family)
MSTVWVFGASGSIGSTLCKALLERGDKVIAFTSSDVSKINTTLKETIRTRFIPQECDLSTLTSLAALMKLIKDPDFAPTHIIFLARGKVPIDSLTEDEIWGELAIRDIMISLVTPIRIVMKLVSQENTTVETVTLVSSQYALVAQDSSLYRDPESHLSSIYAAIRGGIISGARSLGVLAARKGIKVNSLVLGGIKETASNELQSAINSRLPNGSMLLARNACEWLLFLASDKSDGAIGSPIIIDNGWTSI